MTPAQRHRDSLRRFGRDVPPTRRRRQFWEPRRRCAASDCGFGTTVLVCATASVRSGSAQSMAVAGRKQLFGLIAVSAQALRLSLVRATKEVVRVVRPPAERGR